MDTHQTGHGLSGRVVIAGGSGFIGSYLSLRLLEKGYAVTILDSMSPEVGFWEYEKFSYFKTDLSVFEPSREYIEGARALVNLAGRSLFSRWNEEVKRSIYDSRIKTTRNLTRVVSEVHEKPSVFISASATGYYGDRGDEELTEHSEPGDDFLANVCVQWEDSAWSAHESGVRTVLMRTAPVVGPGGMLRALLPIFRWGLGGTLGDGSQWFPWVHINDIVSMYVRAIEDEELSGPVNACSSPPLRNKDFTASLARALNKSAPFSVPAWTLRLRYGDLAEALMVSQKVVPAVLTERGYEYHCTDIHEAFVTALEALEK